jgi:hypothetical protein
MIDLRTFRAIQSNLFVRVEISPTIILTFSDLNTAYTINGDSYLGLGDLMGVTTTTSELRATGDDITITITGIPDSEIADVLNTKFKGASVKVYRALFNATTGALINVSGNPVGRFNGFINNYQLAENFDINSRTSDNTIVITCSSVVTVLNNKVAGRKTNPSSQKRFYPSDLSMDRIPNLESTTFNFGDK